MTMQTDDSTHRQSLAALYDSYNDATILRLVEDDLTEIARDVLHEEIVRRGLSSDLEAIRTTTNDGVAKSLLPVWSGATMEEAAVVLQILGLANIEAMLVPLQGKNPTRRYHIEVAVHDAERASGFIAEGVSEDTAIEMLANFRSSSVAIPNCSSCGSNLVRFETSHDRNCWSCEDCGNHWEELPFTESEVSIKSGPLPLDHELVANTEIHDLAPTRRRRRRSNYRGVFLVLAISFLLLASRVSLPLASLQVFGLTLFIVSTCFWGVARWQLGSSFATKAEARDLVTDGIYRKIQNPIYLFGALSILGIMLYLERPWFLLAFFVLIPLQLLRIKKERRVLWETFGDKYLSYRSHTWF